MALQPTEALEKRTRHHSTFAGLPSPQDAQIFPSKTVSSQFPLTQDCGRDHTTQVSMRIVRPRRLASPGPDNTCHDGLAATIDLGLGSVYRCPTL